MTSLKINGVSYDMADGFIYNDKYTEELDSGTITIPFSDKLNLSPFDFVEISDDRFGTKYFVIDTWVEETVSFIPLKYNYTINLVSETIKLQKVVLPNIAITQPINDIQYTVLDKLTDYLTMYVKPQYNELNSFSRQLIELTDLAICPENLFNRPTAFEVFNTLLSKTNSVVRVNNHEIGCLQLDKYGNEINESKLYYENDTQSIKDYANRLDVQVNNAISDSDNFSTINGITLRGGEGDAVFNDDNMQLILDKPIYDFDSIAGIYVYFPINDNGTIRKGVANITDYVVEKSVYDTYLVSTTAGWESRKNYKRNALYYVRGDNKIQGLNYSDKTWASDSWIALYNILYSKIRESDDTSVAVPSFDESQTRNNVSFFLEYKTSDSYRTNTLKENTYNATLIDNQSESQVDAENFGKVEQDKLNRLGNKAKIITATYEYDEIIPELGDYIGRYVLAEREIVYYKDYALFKGYLYKDYVRKNMYYGLNSRKRSTQIDVESVIRNDIINYELSFELEKQTNTNAYDGIKRYILYPLMLSDYADIISLGYDYAEYPRYCFIKTLGSAGQNLISYSGNILLTPSTYASGKSNIIHLQFQDNFSAGIRLTDNVTGGRKQEYVKYVDDYGRFNSIRIDIYSNKRNDFARLEQGAEILGAIKPIADNLPYVSDDYRNYLQENANYLMNVNQTLKKDNRETTAISINFNYKDSSNVIIGSFAEETGIGFHYNPNYGIYICYSTTDEYELGDEYGLGEMIVDGSASIDYTDGVAWMFNQEEGTALPDGTELDRFKLYLRDIDTSNWKSWGIVQASTNRLILGVNKDNETSIPTTIYLHCKKQSY